MEEPNHSTDTEKCEVHESCRSQGGNHRKHEGMDKQQVHREEVERLNQEEELENQERDENRRGKGVE